MRTAPFRLFRRRLSLATLFATLCSLFASSALAEPIRNPVAVFAGLDKTTGRIINFEVAIDETVQFGTLQVTPRVCNTRPQTEEPQTTSFVEVDDQETAKSEVERVFSGWMFAASPGLHGVEHPVYDVWLVDCKGGKEITAGAPGAAATPAETAAPLPDALPLEKKGSRSRRVEPVAPAPVEPAPIGPEDEAASEVPDEAAEGVDEAAPFPQTPAPSGRRRTQGAQPSRPNLQPMFPD